MIDETKLRELIAEWRRAPERTYTDSYVAFTHGAIDQTRSVCADQLAALLPEPPE